MPKEHSFLYLSLFLSIINILNFKSHYQTAISKGYNIANSQKLSSCKPRTWVVYQDKLWIKVVFRVYFKLTVRFDKFEINSKYHLYSFFILIQNSSLGFTSWYFSDFALFFTNFWACDHSIIFILVKCGAMEVWSDFRYYIRLRLYCYFTSI